MTVRTLIVAAAVLLGGAAARPATAQEPAAPAGPQRKPIDVFQEVRNQITDGRYELAAELLKDFLNLKPTDQDYLDVEAKFGPTVFLQLRNIPRWYDEPKKDAEFKEKSLPAVIQGSAAANAKLTRDPQRIRRFVRNLGGEREEQLFAINELRRSGDAAVPVLVESLRLDTEPEQQAGVLAAVTALGPETVPGFLSAADGLPGELKIGVLRALARRADVLSLINKTDTNFVPLLWYLASSPGGPSAVRDAAADMLRSLVGAGFDRRRPEAELVRAAEPMFDRKGSFVAFDPMTNRVRVWEWDASAQNVKASELTPSQAEERFGLKYLRWAIDRQPGYELATSLFLALATERAVERMDYTDLARAEPGVYQLLTAAPAGLLIPMLGNALAENRTALAYGLTQVLGDRVEKSAAIAETRPDGSRQPPVLAKALSYPDPRVQLAAAVALLRMPLPPAHGANARVVEVLARAAAADVANAGTAKGKAVVADPVPVRGDEVAALLRGLGYQTETVGTGRALLRRVNRASDVDLILVDRHIVDPTLRDVLANLRADANAGRRPVLVVASADAPKPIGLESLLLRLALLIAATETADITVPPVSNLDRRKPADEIERERQANAEDRDKVFTRLFRERLGRLQRLVQAADLPPTAALRSRLDLRLPQLTYAALIAEYQPTPATAPTLFRDYNEVTTLLRRQTNLDEAVRGVPQAKLIGLIQQLESAVTPELRKNFEAFRSRIDPVALALPTDQITDPSADTAVVQLARQFPGVNVIPEPYATVGFRDDVNAAFADPAQRPRAPAEKKAAARTAVEWLRRIAVGEITGYDIRPAESALRQAIENDELAELAIEALGHIPSAAAQQDLIRVATTSGRPLPVRLQAATAAVRHVQTNGKLAPAPVEAAMSTEPNPDLRARFLVLRALFNGKPGELAERIKGYAIPAPSAAAPPKEPAPQPGASKDGDTKPPAENPKS